MRSLLGRILVALPVVLAGCACPPPSSPGSRVGAPVPVAATTTLILVRHAEKLDDAADPPLTEEGRDRAEALARILADAGVSVVYSTDLIRTRATASPLAEARGLELQIYDADRAAAEARAIIERHPGQTVLIVGHSPSVPAMVNALLDAERLSKLDRYDELFVLTVSAKAPPKLLRLHYGAPR